VPEKDLLAGLHDHLRIVHLVEAQRRPGAAATLARRTLDHLVALCPVCRRHWQRLRNLQPVYMACLDTLEVPVAANTEPAMDDLDASPPALAAQAARVAELRRLRRRAQEEMWLLLRLPAEQRAGKIHRARRRFRSRQLAELLLRECEERVRSEPIEARRIAELVPSVLQWASGDAGPVWAAPLLVRAAARRADAMRAAGDLSGADRVFADLQRSLASRPLADPAALAEVLSLKGALRIDQSRSAEAEQVLRLARLAHDFQHHP